MAHQPTGDVAVWVDVRRDSGEREREREEEECSVWERVEEERVETPVGVADGHSIAPLSALWSTSPSHAPSAVCVEGERARKEGETGCVRNSADKGIPAGDEE